MGFTGLFDAPRNNHRSTTIGSKKLGSKVTSLDTTRSSGRKTAISVGCQHHGQSCMLLGTYRFGLDTQDTVNDREAAQSAVCTISPAVFKRGIAALILYQEDVYGR
ncbi:hypothetical protein MBLNU457_6054t1 [Dothideomycetes sp. NU457]